VKGAPCIVSVAEHAGWAHLVCVAAADRVPVVIERRRVTTIDAGLPNQPYHHESIGMEEGEANALVARVRQSVHARTALALRQVMTDLAPTHVVVALAIRESPFRELPETVADVWKSYRLQSCADGMLYQLATCRAARDLDLEVYRYPRSGEVALAAEQLGTTPEDIESFVSRTGRPSGPPWTQEHRRAFAAGIAALARRTRERITIPQKSTVAFQRTNRGV
jgi:hypothetical protein